MEFKEFAAVNRLRVKWNGAGHLVPGRFGELADMGDGGRFRLRLLAVPRGRQMSKALLNRRRMALAGGLELKHSADAESIFYFDPTDTMQVELVIRLVGAKRRRQLSPEQRQELLEMVKGMARTSKH